MAQIGAITPPEVRALIPEIVVDDRDAGVFRVNRRAFIDQAVLTRTVAGLRIIRTNDRQGELNCFLKICTYHGAILCRDERSTDHHNLILSEYPAPGLKRIGLELETDAELEILRKALNDEGIPAPNVSEQECKRLYQGASFRISEPYTGATYEFMVSDIDEISKATGRFSKQQVRITWRPERHPPSRTISPYYHDLEGITAEHSFGMEEVSETGPRKPRVLLPTQENIDYLDAPRYAETTHVGAVEAMNV